MNRSFPLLLSAAVPADAGCGRFMTRCRDNSEFEFHVPVIRRAAGEEVTRRQTQKGKEGCQGTAVADGDDEESHIVSLNGRKVKK